MKRPDRLLIFTGDGKGKTTAALGMALRCVGHGMSVLIVQFVKSDSSTGEIAALGSLPGVEIMQCGLGFIPRSTGADLTMHREAARRGLSLAREALSSGRFPLVVLDEVCVAISARLLEIPALLEVLSDTAPGTCVAITGRGAPPQLLEMADTVTEMRCVKHGYRQGIPAQPGVEY